MKTKHNISSAIITGTILILAVTVLPVIYIKPDEMLHMTITQLCKSYPSYSYLVTAALTGFGADSVISGWKRCGGTSLNRFMLLMFGSTFIAASVFNHLSQYDFVAALLPVTWIPRYFAAISLLSFSVMTISSGFVLTVDRDRILSFLAGSTLILAVLFQSESENYAGLWQKVIILIICGWIILSFTRSADNH